MCDGATCWNLIGSCKNRPLYIGFEPDPRNVAELYQTDLMGWVHFYAAAAGNVNGLVDFYLSSIDGFRPYSSSLSEFKEHLTIFPHIKCIGKTQVQSVRLDSVIPYHTDHVDLLWMDVQGAERLVFEGAQDTLRRTKFLYTEYDSGHYYVTSSSRDQIIAQLGPDWEPIYDTGSDLLLRRVTT